MPAKQYKGLVLGNPQIIRTKQGVLTGKLVVRTEDHDKPVNCFYNDPHDLTMFSFADGDEVKLTVKESNGFFNGTVKTPTGSVEDAQAACDKAVEAFNRNPLEDLAEVYFQARLAVMANEGMQEELEELDDPDLEEDLIQKATASVYIQFFRDGKTLADIS